MAAFKVGDTVRLKSGGPVMTVVEVGADNVDCQWFTGDGAPERAGFPPDALKSWESPKGRVKTNWG